MNGLLLVAGIAGLWLGTEFTIRGAIAISARLRLSEFVVGVAILAIGSDLPELAVAIDAAIKNLHAGETSDVVVGTALGSSMGQIGFVLGVAGLLTSLTLPIRVVYRHGAVLLGSIVLVALIGYDGVVSRTEGVSLVTVYVVYFLFLITEARISWQEEGSPTALTLPKAAMSLVVGLVVVTISAEVTVEAVNRVAIAFDIEKSLIALMVIGLGTSLPELSISIAAILKKRARMSVGNLIGSNIFDTLVPIGVAAAISRIDFDEGMLMREVPFLFVLSALVLVFFRTEKGIQKWEAAAVLSLYCGYAVIKISGAGPT